MVSRTRAIHYKEEMPRPRTGGGRRYAGNEPFARQARTMPVPPCPFRAHRNPPCTRRGRSRAVSLCLVQSRALVGLEAAAVTVEVHLANGVRR
jgi:hypothetical protein